MLTISKIYPVEKWLSRPFESKLSNLNTDGLYASCKKKT